MQRTFRIAFFITCPIFFTLGCGNVERSSIDLSVDSVQRREKQSREVESRLHTETQVNRIEKLASIRLPNAIRIHPNVVSGGQPDGEQAFHELQNLGIRTIISVDGAKPNVNLARKYGMRYVHLPHGYNGVPDERAKELALAVHELDPPIYIHCHHGKHRSPAAAAIACIANGLIDVETASSVLTTAGTNKNYIGLFASVAKARRMSEAELKAVQTIFPESTTLSPLAESMVELDHTFEQLKAAIHDGWDSIAERSNSQLIHQSLILKEHFTEMLRLSRLANESQEFRELLVASEATSDNLLRTLERGRDGELQNSIAGNVRSSLDEISSKCTRCHQLFRDVP